MMKSLIAATALFFSLSLSAGDASFDELADRVDHQEQHLYQALAGKTTSDDVAKIKKGVDNHVDIYLAEASSETKARIALKRVAFLKKSLPKYFSKEELADLRLQLALISAFGPGAMD